MTDWQKRTGAEDYLEIWAWLYGGLVTLLALLTLAAGLSEIEPIATASSELGVVFLISVGVGWFLSVGVVPLLLVIANISRLLRK